MSTVEVTAAAPSRPRPAGGFRYLPALDGLRAIAVVAVILYHGQQDTNGPKLFPGGFLGVEVFFVISGYLITALLLDERRRTGTVGLKQFWARRARRLLPALFVVLAAVAAYWLIFIPDEVAKIRGDLAAALTYSTNWYLIFSKQSYFDANGRPSPLRHLWSLAIEEQFYLVWPFIAGLLLARLRTKRSHQMLLLCGVALASAIEMALLYSPGHDPSRVYYGTDTRATGLLLGAALAYLWPPWRLQTDTGQHASRILDGVGLAALVGLGLFFCYTNDVDPFIYRGGYLLLDLTALAIIAVAVHPASVLWRKALGAKPMVWVGKRSYVLYLWHWPIFMITRPVQDLGINSWVVVLAIRLGLTVVLAQLTYRYIEEPIRHGTLWARLKDALSRHSTADPRWRRRVRWGLAAAWFGLALIVLGTMTSTRPSTTFALGLNGRTSIRTTGATAVPTTATPVTAPATTVPGQTTTAPPTTLVTSDGSQVDAIGDSVMLGAVDAMQKRLPGIVVDAMINRKFSAASAVVDDMKAHGQLRTTMVIHLGTNAAMTDSDIDDVFAKLPPGARVFLINTNVNREWQPYVNRRLAAAAQRHPNTTLLDWNHYSAGHSSWFFPDGTHLNEVGKAAYANYIATAIGK